MRDPVTSILMRFAFRLLFLASLPLGVVVAADRPNILWITSEDNSVQWIGCYGNEQAQTPRIDALAREGILFEHAYSNAPVCAPARATLLNGMYSPTMGTQHMRSRHRIPRRYRPYVEYLRQAGYYCTNNEKTDYNFEGDDNAIWDESSEQAHYSRRPAGAPFLAVFNLMTTHESSLFANRPAEPRRLTPAEVDLPPYVPDIPEMRKDFARYHDRIARMDGQVGQLLDELAEAGLADDTIVIYNADNGGGTPRGKRYLRETGVRIPLIIHVPERWRSLATFASGERVAEPVSFVDFLPTLLSLAGIEIPSHLQGRPFLGPARVEPAPDDMVLLYADRFDETYGMRRALTDGDWKYIRRFTPHLPAAPYGLYIFGQPSWTAWREAWRAGKLTDRHRQIWEAPQQSEQLYNLDRDPWEVHNLADDPAFADKLAAMRGRLKDTMRSVTDTGVVPEPLFETLRAGSTIADFVQSDRFDYDAALDLAFAATQRDASLLPKLKQGLASASPVDRYWALCGMIILGDAASREVATVTPLLDDAASVNRATAAFALWTFGRRDAARSALLGEAARDIDTASLLYLLNTLQHLDLLDDLPAEWVSATRANIGEPAHVDRFPAYFDRFFPPGE